MIASTPSGQGRARGLYDEQLQRQQQEKALLRGALPGVAPAFFQLTAPALQKACPKSGRVSANG